MNMIEKVARALKPRNGCDSHKGCENPNIPGGCACRDDARAAIEAIGEPTEAMCEAGANYVRTEGGSIAGIYSAMIDAALKEGQTNA